MADHLMRLAERSLGVGEVVLPRARAPFIAAPVELLELKEEHVVEPTPRDRDRRWEAAQVPARPQKPPSPGRRAEPSLDVAVEREASEVPAEPSRSPRSASAAAARQPPAAAEPTPPPSTPARFPAAEPTPPPSTPARFPAAEPTPPPSTPARVPAAEVDRLHEPPGPATTLARDLRQAVRLTSAQREGLPVWEPQSTPRSLPPPPVKSPRAQEPAAEGTPSGRAESPVVRVTIGRVDVRAVLPSPPAEHSRPKRAPRLTLDEYLRESRAQ
jgi:hypothetical protein